ncbi:hypothetical protein VNO78_15858 [Psophocarpus tetragonolobus]|uniref:Dol-P-Glc:Glc(2)Man(9)GlcNAc(2)-PP-Dol alpha-1,2-glucosyltransferase n=1 Tax=Psophocarpus tetragonolobus TaxID=3891 RepID=A0AAN9XJJ2_PSOTE
MLHAVVLSLYLLHCFFTFLYYTDVASVTAVLAMYLACLKKKFWFSTLVSRGKHHTKTAESDVSTKHGLAYDTGFADEIWAILSTLWYMKWELLISFIPFLMVVVAFLLFVYWNGSVVLGAKEAHAVTPHYAQILYFSLVSLLAQAPMHFTITQAVDLFHMFRKSRPLLFFQMFLALVVGILSVHFFRLCQTQMTKYTSKQNLCFDCQLLNACSGGKFRSKIWVLAYFLATAAVLVPAPLIEFRYYTIPLYFLVLHCDNRDDHSWILTGSLYIGVNIFTMMMFLFRPFHWDPEPGVQRFIW